MAMVNPTVLTWARKQSGNITVDDVARRLRVPAERVADWENGVSFPSWSQLSSLAQWYRLPTVYFYMKRTSGSWLWRTVEALNASWLVMNLSRDRIARKFRVCVSA